jgi:hypothetical protein
MHDMVRHWGDLLSLTTVSRWLQDQEWVIPTSQSIHIVCVSVVFASAMVISCRLLGLGATGRSVSQLSKTLVPWMYRALGVLLLTGTVQTVAEPVRQFVTPAFWWKMVMIVCVVSLTTWFARTVRANATTWDGSATRPASARVFALISLGLWVGIIFCGRFIGYTYQFHI